MLKSVKNLFASPLVAFEYPEFAKLNQTLLSEISMIRKASPGVKRSNQHDWHSENDVSRSMLGFYQQKHNLNR